jgi:hypothetical protein
MAAAISAADRNFSFVIQLLHLIQKANSVCLRYGNGEVTRSIKGTHYHVASTPREVGVSSLKSSGATFAARGSSRNLGGRSVLGQSRRFDDTPITSGIPFRTDIRSTGRPVSKVPTAKVRGSTSRRGQYREASNFC